VSEVARNNCRTCRYYQPPCPASFEDETMESAECEKRPAMAMLTSFPFCNTKCFARLPRTERREP
jgi:hypothetical protein